MKNFILKRLYLCILILLQVSEECNILRLNLSDAQHECDLAKQERGVLQNKVGNLEETIKVSSKCWKLAVSIFKSFDPHSIK
jgi:hypothetical protein